VIMQTRTKKKEWQGYAAMVAAACAKTLLQKLVSNQIKASETMAKLLGTRS